MRGTGAFGGTTSSDDFETGNLSGWTVFNNKGKPVRQFEPFFSDTHALDQDAHIGVSPWLVYDPVERVVATLHPAHTWEKTVFDPLDAHPNDRWTTEVKWLATFTPRIGVTISCSSVPRSRSRTIA
jgi:hypothetical protein